MTVFFYAILFPLCRSLQFDNGPQLYYNGDSVGLLCVSQLNMPTQKKCKDRMGQTSFIYQLHHSPGIKRLRALFSYPWNARSGRSFYILKYPSMPDEEEERTDSFMETVVVVGAIIAGLAYCISRHKNEERMRIAMEYKVVRVTPFGNRFEVGFHGTQAECEEYCDAKDWEWKTGTGLVNGLNVVPAWTVCD